MTKASSARSRIASSPDEPVRWLEVSILARREDAGAVAALLDKYWPGGVIEEEEVSYLPGAEDYTVDLQAPVILRAYLTQESAGLWPAVRRRIYRLPNRDSLRTSSRWLAEEDWAHSWKKFFPVQHVGQCLVIRPIWCEYSSNPGDVVIDLDPGLAFGTGLHPTTRLCLQALEEVSWEAMKVLDVGTGSAILAIAAGKLGASSVIALDTDPQAVKAATSNVKLNGLGASIVALEGSLGMAWPHGLPQDRDFDLALVNISASAICDLAGPLASVLGHDGLAIVSGFLEEKMANVSAALAQERLFTVRTLGEGDWRAIIASKE